MPILLILSKDLNNLFFPKNPCIALRWLALPCNTLSWSDLSSVQERHNQGINPEHAAPMGLAIHLAGRKLHTCRSEGASQHAYVKERNVYYVL